MKRVDCDFHIHSRFSAATSKNMSLETIAKGAVQKGLSVVATGDALNKHWLEEIESLKFENGLGELNGCRFILTTEVEDKNRVHHLIILSSIESAYTLRELVERSAPDIDTDGRPHLRLGGEEIAKAAHESDALIGPSHAFVPWTSVYKEFNSLADCYGSEAVDFLELGLSADTYLANQVKELEDITFLSNSDAHSAQPHRLGREFNRLEVESISFQEIRMAIQGHKKRGIVLNVGLDPRLGKYHRTSCIKCFTHYTLDDARESRWRCPKCGGLIKKGVLERISELSNSGDASRPRYLRIAPLAEIIVKISGVSTVYSKKVHQTWSSLVEAFGSEIAVLVDAPIEEIFNIHAKTAQAVSLYRAERFTIVEGGGGRYGEIVFEKIDSEETPSEKKIAHQRSLDMF